MYYADDDSFMQVMKKVNPFLRRTAVLLDGIAARIEEELGRPATLVAGQRELTEEDVQFLHNNGIKVGVWERDDVRSVF